MEATTDKAAEKERDRRMRQVNAENETVTVDKQAANDVPIAAQVRFRFPVL